MAELPPVEIAISNTNIAQIVADLVALKYADGFFGADKAVAARIRFDAHVERGDARFARGVGIAATEVVFIGVGPLSQFRYERIQEFGSRAIQLARHHSSRHLALTIHGPGYGLDPEQSFLSMIAGIVAETRAETTLEKITVAELSGKRCALLESILEERLHEFGLRRTKQPSTVTLDRVNANDPAASLNSNVVQFGVHAEDRPRLFVAMPFSEEFDDEYEIGFFEAAKVSSYSCERLDLESFTGDIVAEIKKRIVESHGVIALLNNHNPNVFLEIGFALAHGKPTILVAREGVALPFDVSGHRCLRYRNIVQLRKLLTAEIASLKAQGILARTG